VATAERTDGLAGKNGEWGRMRRRRGVGGRKETQGSRYPRLWAKQTHRQRGARPRQGQGRRHTGCVRHRRTASRADTRSPPRGIARGDAGGRRARRIGWPRLSRAPGAAPRSRAAEGAWRPAGVPPSRAAPPPLKRRRPAGGRVACGNPGRPAAGTSKRAPAGAPAGRPASPQSVGAPRQRQRRCRMQLDRMLRRVACSGTDNTTLVC